MEIVFLLVRILLAGIFALAGVAKFIDLKGSEKAFQDFGVPKALALPGALALSAAEVAIAGLLLSVEFSWFGAMAALALLLLFIVQMIYQLARGNAPDCHCFGQLHSEPVSSVSIFRNILFAILAAFLFFSGRNSQGMSLADPRLDIMQLAFGVGIVALLMAAIFYLRQIMSRQNEIMRRIELMELVARDGATVERDEMSHPHEGLPIGAVVPDFVLPDLSGGVVSLADVRVADQPVMFIFVSPNCTPCKALMPEFEQWQKELEGKVKLIFVSTGEADENVAKFTGSVANEMLLQTDREFAEIVKARWTPTAVLMDANGRIASHVAAGDTAIRALVEQVKSEDLSREFVYFTNGSGHSHTTKIGENVPQFSTADISGREITSDTFRGKQTLVAFWSLNCGYCEQMIEDLREWDGVKGADGPALIVFSDGDDAANASLGLASPVITDAGHKTAAGFGMFGTPSAVLVNEDGKIVSETAVGANDIWSLIGKRK